MGSALSNCRGSVEVLFEELIRSHEVAGTPAPIGAASRDSSLLPSPPRRQKRELAFWESDREQRRIAELSAMLAPPDFGAAALGPRRSSGALDTMAEPWSDECVPSAIEDRKVQVAPGNFPSIAPVAISAVAMDIAEPLPPLGGERALRWLVPVSAGVFALGALAVPGAVRVATAHDQSPGAFLALPAPPDGAWSIEAEHALDIELRADLLAQGALAAADLLQGPALAAFGPEASSRSDARAESLPHAAAASRPGAIASDDAGLAPPRGSASPRAWRAAAQLGKASGRHVRIEARDEPLEIRSTSAAPFDAQAARTALQAAASLADVCAAPGDGTQLVPVSVTFAPSGRATVVQVSGPLAGTETGSCVARALRGASIPAFSGQAVTVTRTVRVR